MSFNNYDPFFNDDEEINQLNNEADNTKDTSPFLDFNVKSNSNANNNFTQLDSNEMQPQPPFQTLEQPINKKTFEDSADNYHEVKLTEKDIWAQQIDHDLQTHTQYSKNKRKGVSIGMLLAIVIPLLIITNIFTSMFIFDYAWSEAKAEYNAEVAKTLSSATILPSDSNLIAQSVGSTQLSTVVEIYSSSPTGSSSGSGFFISQDGYLITNAHVVTYDENVRTGTGFNTTYKTVTSVCPAISLQLPDVTTQYELTVIDFDTELDLALCKLSSMPAGATVAKIGDSTNLAYGEPCVAIGNAQGYGTAITDGIISHPCQYFSLSSRGYTAAIQHSAAINPGNSGGPLFNMHGEVIGVNSFKLTANSDISIDGMGFAIPSAVFKDYVNGLNISGLTLQYEE